MITFFRSIRLVNSLAAILLLIGLQHYFNHSVSFLELIENNEFLFLLGSVFLALSGGYALNNAIDKTSDQINQKNNVILETKQLYTIGVTGHLLSLFLVLFIPEITIWSVVYINIIILFYNLYFKKVVIVGNFLIAFLSLIPFYIILQINVLESVFVVEQKIDFIILFSLVSFFGTFAREIIKDIEDIKGDQMVQMKTLPIVFSESFAKITATLFILATLIVYNSILYNHVYYHFNLLIAIIGFVFVSTPLILSINAILNKKINNPKLAQNLIKAGMFFSILFLFFL